MSLKEQAFQSGALNKQEIYAIRMLETGEANSAQQALALSVILKKLCRVYDVHFVPGEPDVSVFLAGRGFVGQEIMKLLRLDPTQLHNMKE